MASDIFLLFRSANCFSLCSIDFCIVAVCAVAASWRLLIACARREVESVVVSGLGANGLFVVCSDWAGAKIGLKCWVWFVGLRVWFRWINGCVDVECFRGWIR